MISQWLHMWGLVSLVLLVIFGPFIFIVKKSVEGSITFWLGFPIALIYGMGAITFMMVFGHKIFPEDFDNPNIPNQCMINRK